MGKEVRVGLYVLGGLLLMFCTLLYVRLFGPNLAVPAMTISSPTEDVELTTLTTEKQVPLQPTIVRPSNWDEIDEQPHTRNVETISAETVQEEHVIERHTNPRRIEEASSESDRDLVNPRATQSPSANDSTRF